MVARVFWRVNGFCFGEKENVPGMPQKERSR